MVTATASPVFVDTNILVYARAASSPFHTIAVEALDKLKSAGLVLWSSRQVFREYLSATTRPATMSPPMAVANLIADVRGFEARFQIAEDGPAVTAELLRLLATITSRGKQIHDANIVATMLAHGITNLLTNNAADFVRFAGIITVIPLAPPVLPPGANAPGSPGPGVP